MDIEASTNTDKQPSTRVHFDLHSVLGKTMQLGNPVRPTRIDSRKENFDIRMKCQLLNHGDNQCMKIKFSSNVGFIDNDYNKEGRFF